nr:MAG TPA: hypothetical protein [Caudoviricetes sp.]
MGVSSPWLVGSETPPLALHYPLSQCFYREHTDYIMRTDVKTENVTLREHHSDRR